MGASDTEFGLSACELSRRREAYTRLVTFVALGALLSSVDLLARRSLAAVLAVSALFILLLMSRILFVRSLARYAHTVWVLTDLDLVRAREGRRDVRSIGDVEHVSVKRTVSGGIRAVTVRVRGTGSLYVNALEDPQRFVGRLRSATAVPFSEVREPLDFDAPWFYRVLGLLIGVVISAVVRVAATPGVLNARWVYLCVSAYLVLFGVFWIRSRPTTQSYGDGMRHFDVVLGLLSLVIGLALGMFALAVPIDWPSSR